MNEEEKLTKPRGYPDGIVTKGRDLGCIKVKVKRIKYMVMERNLTQGGGKKDNISELYT